MRLQLPVPCFCRAPLAKKICRRTSTVPRKPESAPQVSSCLARSSVDLYQASCSSIHTLLLIPLPCKHVHLHAPNSSAMPAYNIYIYIYIYGKIFLLLYTHTSNPSMHYGRNSRPWLQPTYCFPALETCSAFCPFVFLLQHMQTFKQIAPCMHVNNASKQAPRMTSM